METLEDGTLSVKVDDGKFGKGMELSVGEDTISADTSKFSAGSRLGSKTYPKLFALAEKLGKKYKPDNLLDHNYYRFQVNVMKHKEKGGDISNIVSSTESDKVFDDKTLRDRADEILGLYNSGKPFNSKGDMMNLSDANLEMLNRFKSK